jgi:hypothetical protein
MNGKELYNLQEAYLEIYKEDEVISEGLRHPASRALRPQMQNLVRTSTQRRLSTRSRRAAKKEERKGFYAKKEGDEKKHENLTNNAEALKNLSKLSRKRAETKEAPESRYNTVGTTLRRLHLSPENSQKEWDSRSQSYRTGEQIVRLTRANNAGYHGSNLTSKNEKKQRKDEGMRTMFKTPVPKAGYKEWSKEKLKEYYEFILEYLISEGYADTLESAEGIFEVMSEGWFETILLNEAKWGEQDVPYGRMMNKSNRLSNSDDPKKQHRGAMIYLAANTPKGKKVKIRR